MASSKQRIVMTLASAGVPVDTVTIAGNTAAVTYMAGATAAQKLQGATLLAAYDWSDAAEQAWQDAQNPERSGLANAAAQAVVDINTYLALPSPTNAQVVAIVGKLCVDVRAIIKRLVQVG